MAPVRQGSFLGGELAPQMWGRTDSPAYGQGLRLLRNAFVARQGSICKRPGTEYCGLLGIDLPPLPEYHGPARLIPFIYSEETSYVLAFLPGMIAVWQDGVLINAVAATTDYSADDIWRLKFVQSGDVMVITHPSHPPKTLARQSDGSWQFLDVDFGPAGTTTTWMTPGFRTPLPTPDVDNPASNWEWLISYSWVASDRETIVEFEPIKVTRTTRNAGWRESAIWSAGASYGLGDFVRVSTAPTATLYRSINGSGNINQPPASSPTYWESVPNTTAPEVLPVGPTKPVHLLWGLHGDGSYETPPPGMLAFAGVRIYRGRNGSFGLVGVHDGNSDRWWSDYGQEPDYSQPPPEGRNPFEVRDLINGSVRRTERPAVVGYHQERRIYARTDERPETLWASRVADYDNFDQPIPLLPESALDVRLASRRREEVRSMLALERLLLFTNGSVWGLDGGGIEGALDATAIPQARILSEVGASWVDPVIIDGAVVYPRSGNDGLQRLAYSQERGGYTGGDITHLAQHLFRGREVVAWDYARAPHGLTWVALDDGTLLSLTYLPELDVAAWAQHDVGGAVESICVVPEDGQHTAYLSVRRSTADGDRRFLERIRHGQQDDSQARYLDAHVVTGPQTGPLADSAPVYGSKVMQATLDGVPTATFTASPAGGFTVPIEPGVTVQEVVYGLPFETSIDLLDLPAGGVRQKQVVSVGFEVRETGPGLFLGEQESTAVPWNNRKVGDAVNQTGPFTGIAKVDIRSSWNLYGRAVLRHRAPLHLEVLGITREVDVGG